MHVWLAALVLSLSVRSVSLASISGRVTEEGSNRPLPRMTVMLVSESDMTETITDADGRYTFGDLRPGRYAIGADGGEHRATYLRRWFGERAPAGRFSRPPRYPIEIKEDEARTNVDIALTRALAIEGRVTLPSDEPLANVSVSATARDGSSVGLGNRETDELGRYRLYGLAPGSYRVCVELRDRGGDGAGSELPLVPTCYPAAISREDAADVTLTTADAIGIDITAQRTGGRSISGYVSDSTGAAVDGAFVHAIPVDEQDAQARATTQAGAFVLRALVPGRYTIVATIGGGPLGDANPPVREREMGFAAVDLTGGDVSSVNIAVVKTAQLSGILKFDGTPVPTTRSLRMTVHTMSVESHLNLMSQPPHSGIADDLTFTLKDVYHLPLLVRLSWPPTGWTLKSVRLDGRDITFVPTDLAAAAGGTLEVTMTNHVAQPRVTVTDESAAPVLDCLVVVLPSNPAQWQAGLYVSEDRPGPDGAVTLAPLVPGEYLLAAVPVAAARTLWRRDRKALEAVASVATRVSLREQKQQRVDLRLVVPPPVR